MAKLIPDKEVFETSDTNRHEVDKNEMRQYAQNENNNTESNFRVDVLIIEKEKLSN